MQRHPKSPGAACATTCRRKLRDARMTFDEFYVVAHAFNSVDACTGSNRMSHEIWRHALPAHPTNRLRGVRQSVHHGAHGRGEPILQATAAAKNALVERQSVFNRHLDRLSLRLYAAFRCGYSGRTRRLIRELLGFLTGRQNNHRLRRG
jgi:hypothetical protein